MRTSKSSPSPAPARGNIAVDLRPFLVEFNDGRRWVLVRHETVAASDDKTRSANGVVTKDVVIDDETGVSVRVFLPVDAAVAAAAGDGRRLPLVVYVHGGAFCTGSASARMFHDYAESLSARAAAVVVSVDYRLAPAHPVPAAYDDAWAALRWAASRRRRLSDDTWPYFWGTKWLPCETPYACWRTRGSPPMLLPERIDALWPYVTVGAAANNGDDPRIDPSAEAIASLPCRRALESVATEDVLRGRGRRYAAAWGDSGSHRAATLVESKGVDHCFHLLPEFSSHAETGVLMDRVAMFIAKGKTPPPNTRGCLDGG
ncbi:hypothetical protein OsI_09168 [Oryza sativa Indica Group]|uniref:Alpha/beta hydrolase fold-3 domain-containing protein n=1 Tax=Oryza sativa subsp. indica TaxID=39946 RepID=B8AJI3_ORYSI|nr:hypothetical protein OsI_09168 [Oryza sativa Indica Group]